MYILFEGFKKGITGKEYKRRRNFVRTCFLNILWSPRIYNPNCAYAYTNRIETREGWTGFYPKLAPELSNQNFFLNYYNFPNYFLLL